MCKWKPFWNGHRTRFCCNSHLDEFEHEQYSELSFLKLNSTLQAGWTFNKSGPDFSESFVTCFPPRIPSCAFSQCTKCEDSLLQFSPVCPVRDNEDHRKEQAAKIIQRWWKLYQNKVRLFFDQGTVRTASSEFTLVLASTVIAGRHQELQQCFPELLLTTIFSTTFSKSSCFFCFSLRSTLSAVR